MEDYKETVYKAFRKRKRMKTIANSPFDSKLTQSFDVVIVQKSISSEASFEKMIIRKVDAQFYIEVLGKAISELTDTEQEPYQKIIVMKHLEGKSRIEICDEIGYEPWSYHEKLKHAQRELAEIINAWGLNIE